MSFKGLALIFLSLSLMACSSSVTSTNSPSADDGRVTAKVIYGVDNRIDVYQAADANWRLRAESTVALIPNGSLLPLPGGGYSIAVGIFGDAQKLCATEPFYNQPKAADCSGTLIAPDIILSAGHCARTLKACQSKSFVFNFTYNKSTDIPVTAAADDVYTCKELIYSEVNSKTMSDFSLIRLDRPVVGRLPLAVRQSGEISLDDELTVIGHPAGLPTKIADKGQVRKNADPVFFVTNLDTYGGNSGSGVFNSKTGLLEGILVRGSADFVFKNGCYMSNVCTALGCRGEDVTRVSQIFSHMDMNELVTPVPASN